MKLTWSLYRSEDGKTAYATQVDHDNVHHLQTNWKPNAPVRVGDYVALLGNGDLEVHDETHFGDTFSRPDQSIDIVSVV